MAGSKLEDAVPDAGSDFYYDKAFRRVIEDNLDIIRKSPNTHALALKPYHAELYKGHFFSLLYEYKIPVYLHWIMMRLNYMSNPSDYTGLLTVFIPDFRIVENLLNTYRTRYKTIT
jgi:hypothetical protein